MTRTFNSIGHGGFCTEEFKGFTMVYDCGGKNTNIVNREIAHSLTEKQPIDALFISHFHRDHINGLPYLLNNHPVKRVFLPFLLPDQKIQLLIENERTGNADPFVSDLISDYRVTIQTYSQIGEETQVIAVLANNENNNESDREPVRIESVNRDISSGQNIGISTSGGTIDWVYIPFNFMYNKYAPTLADELNKIGIDISNIHNKLKTDKNKIVTIYEKIMDGSTNFNSNSLVLYSGLITSPSESAFITYFSHFPNYHFGFGDERICCLYSGDYNASGATEWHKLETAYKKYWDHIGTIQIPHHGSSYNYNRGFNSSDGIYSIMHVNKNSRHPHATTVKSIIMGNGFPVIVTQDPVTRFIERINY